MTHAPGLLAAVIICLSFEPAQASPQEADAVIKLKDLPFSMAFSPNGKQIALATCQPKERSCLVCLYDASTTKLISTIAGCKGFVRFMTFSPDGRILATSSDDRTVRLWNVESNPPAELAKVGVDERTLVAFSPDGRVLVSCTSTEFDGSDFFQVVQLWTWKEGKLIARGSFKNQSSVAAFGFTPDGKTLMVGNTNSGMGQGLIRFWDISGDEPKARATVMHKDRVQSVAFSDDGKRAALGWGNGGAGGVKLWDLGGDAPKETADLKLRDWVTCVAFSRDGESLAAAGGGFFEMNPLTVWDLRGRIPQERYRARAGVHVSQVSFSPDGSRLAAIEDASTAGGAEFGVRILSLPPKGKKPE